MRVAYLTAGAGGMYCGSCLRDNALAAALIRSGRDVVLLPVYSPIRTDGPDVSDRRVFYGGINIFLQQKAALFRHLPRFLDRLLSHPSLLRLAMKRAGAASPKTAAPLVVSILRGEAGRQRKELGRLIAGLADLRPDLVHLPNAFFVGLAAPIKRELAAAVVCTLTGEDVLLEKLPEPAKSEALALIRSHGTDVDAFLSVSRYYAAYAAERFGIAPERIHPIPLGIPIEDESGEPDRARTPPATDDRPFTIGYLARVCPDKGLHVLCDAFRILHDRNRACRLVAAGYIGTGDRGYLRDIQADMARCGLDRVIDFRGEVDRAEKLAMLRSIDVLSVPTVYREAKGLYVLEALSQGVPVVSPRHGAFPELIEATGGGLLVEPHDPTALADALGRLMDDAELRGSLGSAGRAAVRSSFTDEIMATAAWAVFERVAGKPR
ncbi:MAG: glycosyltransferase family 4 protein [Phycisphaerae bacterium]